MGSILYVYCAFFHSLLCTVTDCSAVALPNSVKFCTAVRFGHTSDRFSEFLLFWGDSPRYGSVLGVNRRPYGGIFFLLKH